MKVIGVEFRLGMQGFRDIEVFCKEVDIVFPLAHPHIHEPRYSITIHTSRGDVTEEGGFGYRGVMLTPPAPGDVFDQATITAAYDSLRKQIERIREEGGRG